MYVCLTRLSSDYVYKETFFEIRMYAIHTDFIYIFFSRMVFKSTIRNYIYGKEYVQNGEFLKRGANRNWALHSFLAIFGISHVRSRGSGNPYQLFLYFGSLSVHS